MVGVDELSHLRGEDADIQKIPVKRRKGQRRKAVEGTVCRGAPVDAQEDVLDADTVLSRLVARNPCIYLVFELRHPQFPHSLTTDEILFLPFISPRLRIL